MEEVFADLHVHIGRSESGKPIKITAAIKTIIQIRETVAEIPVHRFQNRRLAQACLH